MAYDRLMALEVRDEDRYAEYRRRMTPLLEAHGGRFVLDVRGGEVLRAPDGGTWNRVFLIRFPDVAAHDAFFADPGYREVRHAWYDGSVAAAVQVAPGTDSA